MNPEQRDDRGGDDIKIGNISQSQGIAVGRGARADVRGNIIVGEANTLDASEVRSALTELYAALAEANLPFDALVTAQSAAGKAVQDGVNDDAVDPEVVVPQIEAIGDALTKAQTVIEEGSSLWTSVRRVATALAPVVVGGARVIGAWFGIPL